MTAKDRELTSTGTLPLEKPLTTYDELLDAILHVLRFDGAVDYDDPDKEAFVREILNNEKGNGLLYIDNLETVDDPRILQFLDDLPLGVRALVTSRVERVRVSVFPIQVGPLEGNEIIEYINSLSFDPQLNYLSQLSKTERSTFGSNCNGIALAMRWVASRCKHPKEVLKESQYINQNSRTNEELLEFSFRRIFDNLKEDERLILMDQTDRDDRIGGA